MAASARVVARAANFEAVWIMAIAAGDAGAIHPALQEGAIDVDLVEHLTVGMVETLLEQRWHVACHEDLAVPVGVGDNAAPRVATGAGLDLRTGGSGSASDTDSSDRIDRPRRLVDVP